MTLEPTAEQDKGRVARLAHVADCLAGDQWLFVTDGAVTRIVARRADGQEVALCTLTADVRPDEVELISSALDTARLLFRVRGRAAAEVRRLKAAGDVLPLRDGDFTTNAAMTISEPAFWKFLESRGAGAVTDKGAADAALKKLLNITSKKQLNEDARAQAAWIDLRSAFDAWLRDGR